MTRHPLLPDLQRSRAVLVGCDDGVPRRYGSPEKMATELAKALTVPNMTAAFDAAHTQVVLSPQHPSEMLATVSVAAAAATETVLFYFAARTSPYQPVPGEVLSGPNRA
ncbi:hypothetical protein ACFQ1S_09910, partial [Kibdelosporangium lantanae]